MRKKIKTKKGIQKRFKLTGTGKIKRRYTGKLHMLEHKAKKKKRRNRKSTDLSKADQKKIKLAL
jgi:large subunit ribosomal protein L35